MEQPTSQGKPAKMVELNEDELRIIFNALTEEKHRLMESHKPTRERQPLTEGRKQNILNIWDIQMKIGARMSPPQDTAAPF